MRSKKTLLIVILIFALVLGGAYVLYTQLGQWMTPDQLVLDGLEEAPDFTAYDAGGNEVRLSDYFGKPIVLNFWASWCGPCQMEMPDFNEKYLELGEEVVFLMVNMTDGQRETVKTASDFVKASGYSFPVVFDTAYSAANSYRAYSLPATYFIDAEGRVVAHAAGAIPAKTLQRGIDLISG